MRYKMMMKVNYSLLQNLYRIINAYYLSNNNNFNLYIIVGVFLKIYKFTLHKIAVYSIIAVI